VNFVAIDVETACADRSSICQIGIAVFQQGRMVRCDGLLIDPETEFLAFNSNLHGIVPEHIAGAPTWKMVYPALRELLSNRILVSHTYFDRVALLSACQRYHLEMFPYTEWVDSCEIARKAWPHLPNHKLPSLAENFKIEYCAHDAAEDARVAGEILILARIAMRNPRHAGEALR
jgi:DNA polymerase-3 subunit epsilon